MRYITKGDTPSIYGGRPWVMSITYTWRHVTSTKRQINVEKLINHAYTQTQAYPCTFGMENGDNDILSCSESNKLDLWNLPLTPKGVIKHGSCILLRSTLYMHG